MSYTKPLNFQLDFFQGPLDFLVHLVQKNEIEITDVPVKAIIDQFIQSYNEEFTVDSGAEFIGTTAHIIWLKSKILLPKHVEEQNEEDDADPRLEMIKHLIDYCRFKEASKKLSEKQEEQLAYYPRGVIDEKPKKGPKGLGIEHISLEDLQKLFEQVIVRAQASQGAINEEFYRVSDKLEFIRTSFKSRSSIPFKELFTVEKPRVELIVTFLAILELMKLGETCVVRCQETNTIMIIPYEQPE